MLAWAGCAFPCCELRSVVFKYREACPLFRGQAKRLIMEDFRDLTLQSQTVYQCTVIHLGPPKGQFISDKVLKPLQLTQVETDGFLFK